MKKSVLLLFALLALAPHSAQAQDIATFDFRVGNEDGLKRVVIQLDPDAAPETVANFEKLARHKFYVGLKVHRVIPHTLVQMGDPLSRGRDRTAVGTGGPGYTLPPEIQLRHTVGAVAMARLPDAINPARRSNGSQFYICLTAMPQLDGQYTVFGHVIKGMDVLDDISTQESDTNDNPVTPVVIKGTYLGPGPAHRSSFRLWPW
ncbi:MAG: peptidylprolyl isomerase [Chthoniobacteraceae bacterium]|jgi:peptidyl-prolyl cis-trans isomerase B (cyclophilin B)